MSGCDVVINTTICGNSAVDKVAALMASGVGLNEACKQVAIETDKEHGTTTKWTAVKKKVQRANQLGTVSPPKKKLEHVATLEKELVPLAVPMVNSTTIDTTKYITIEEHNRIIFEYEKASFEDAERFTKIISELEKQLQSKHISKEEANVLIMDQPPEESTLINRSTVFNFIKKYGNEFQCMALKDDNLPNEKLFKVFVKVREQYKTSTPPPAWDKEIINATGILSF